MPGPVLAIAGIFAGDGVGQPDAGEVLAAVCLPEGLEALETGLEDGDEAGGQAGGAVFVAFAAADGDEAGALTRHCSQPPLAACRRCGAGR